MSTDLPLSKRTTRLLALVSGKRLNRSDAWNLEHRVARMRTSGIQERQEVFCTQGKDKVYQILRQHLHIVVPRNVRHGEFVNLHQTILDTFSPTQSSGDDHINDIAVVLFYPEHHHFNAVPVSAPFRNDRAHIPCDGGTSFLCFFSVKKTVVVSRFNRIRIVCPAQRQHQTSRRICDAGDVELSSFRNSALCNDPEGILKTAAHECIHDLKCAFCNRSRCKRFSACCSDADDCLASNEKRMFDQFIDDLIDGELIAPSRYFWHCALICKILMGVLNVAVSALPRTSNPQINTQRAVRHADARERMIAIRYKNSVRIFTNRKLAAGSHPIDRYARFRIGSRYVFLF